MNMDENKMVHHVWMIYYIYIYNYIYTHQKCVIFYGYVE